MEAFSSSMKAAMHWSQVKEYVPAETEDKIRSILLTIAQKFQNTEFIRQSNSEPIKVSGEVVSEKIKPNLILGLQPSESMNVDYVNLMLELVLAMDTHKASDAERLLYYRDLETISELFIFNNMLRVHNRDAAESIDGLKYFWELNKEAENSSERFTSFIGSIAYSSKNMNTGSDSGYLQTINILAVRHQQNLDDFRSLSSAEEMLKAVPW